MSDMNDILQLTQKVQELNRRLAEVENERTALKNEIAIAISQLGELTAIHIRPTSGALRDHMIWVLRNHTGHDISPGDIARDLNMYRDSDRANIRGILGRLLREGRIAKRAHGRYRLA
jgi:hypothetical protein